MSCAALLFEGHDNRQAGVWLAIILAINLLRYLGMETFRKSTKTVEDAEAFLRTALVFNVAVGLVWAVIPAWFLKVDNAHDSIPLVIVACICAGAAVQSASYAAAALAIVIPIMSVILVKFLVIGTRDTLIMSFDVALYFGFLVGASIRVEASVLKMIGLNSDATTLAASLEIEHAASQAAASRLYLLANQDALTGLANRAALSTALASWLDGARDRHQSFFFILLDLDHFKSINDTMGHAAGDNVLREVAGRLAATAPTGSVVARLGGDEFALLVAQPEPSAETTGADDFARVVAQTIMAGVSIRSRSAIPSSISRPASGSRPSPATVSPPRSFSRMPTSRSTRRRTAGANAGAPSTSACSKRSR